MCVVDGRNDEILQHLDVVLRDDFRVDLESLNLLETVDHDGHHAAPRRGLDCQLRHLLLQPLLHLLRLFHHLLDVHGSPYISSTSRISAGNTSSKACTPASASACSRSNDFLSSFGAAPGAAGGAAGSI